MNRLDNISFDKHSIHIQNDFKRRCEAIELNLERIKCQRSKDMALIKLEEMYLWIGKGIRNDQLAIKDVEVL